MGSFRGAAAASALALMMLAALAPSSGAVDLPPEAADEAGDLPGQAADEAELHTHGPDGMDLDPHVARGSSGYDVDLHAPWDRLEYDNQQSSTDVKPDQTTLPSFHAVYMYAKDGVNRFSTYAAMFQADARAASQSLATQYNRGVRWDTRAGNCSQKQADGSFTPAPCLDISVVRSANRTNQFSSNPFQTVSRELTKLFKDNSKKYVVWLDVPYTGACGQGNLYQDTRRVESNNNQGRTLAVIYRPYDEPDPAGAGGFCRGRTVLHEMGHNMGAVQSVAPHAFDGAHCDDSPEDTMCYTSATNGVDTGEPAFDYHNDDYWDPAANPTLNNAAKLAWWTVNLSKFICPTAGCQAANVPQF